jgi:hypothetical protein
MCHKITLKIYIEIALNKRAGMNTSVSLVNHF